MSEEVLFSAKTIQLIEYSSGRPRFEPLCGRNSFYQFIILFSWEGSRQTENRKSRFMNFSAFLALKELEEKKQEGGEEEIGPFADEEPAARIATN